MSVVVLQRESHPRAAGSDHMSGGVLQRPDWSGGAAAVVQRVDDEEGPSRDSVRALLAPVRLGTPDVVSADPRAIPGVPLGGGGLHDAGTLEGGDADEGVAIDRAGRQLSRPRVDLRATPRSTVAASEP